MFIYKRFAHVVKSIKELWMVTAKLPVHGQNFNPVFLVPG
jgi:hypothetical protein